MCQIRHAPGHSSFHIVCKNGLLQQQISYVDFCQVAGFTRSIGVYSLDNADIPPLRSTLVLLLILSALSRRLQGRAALINCSAACLFPKGYSFRSLHYNVSPLVKDVGVNRIGVPPSKHSLFFTRRWVSLNPVRYLIPSLCTEICAH